jgi:hypothetical protein
MKTTDKNNKEVYENNKKIEGITKNESGTQTIQTEKTKILKGTDKEVLIGKDIEKIEKIEENHKSLQRRILNKLMK